jgi:hypothetical protein
MDHADLDRRAALQRLAHLAVGVATAPALLTACGGGGTAPAPTAPVPSANDPLPTGPSVTATVTLDRTRPAPAIDRAMAGLSYEKSQLTSGLFSGSNESLIRLLQLIGPSVLRIGANQVDKSAWRGSDPTLRAITPAQVDAFAACMAAADWRVIWGINMAANTPAIAADEAAYVASTLGNRLLAFEIGNEVDLYHSNGYRPSTWTFTDYLAEWRRYVAAIRAAVPNAPMSGPASASDLTRYSVPFAAQAGSEASLLTHHYYRANGQDATSTLALLLQPHAALVSNLDALVAAAKQARMPGGFRLAECNSFYNGGAPNVSNAHGTALWVLNFLFTNARAGVAGINLHGGGNGTGYTPLGDSGGQIVSVRPEFHALVLFAQMVPGTPVPGTLTTSETINGTAWGVVRPDGGTNVLVVNADATRTIVTTLDVGQSPSRWELLRLTGPSLDSATGTTLGGVPVPADGRWAAAWELRSISKPTISPLRVNVPPASALLLRSA